MRNTVILLLSLTVTVIMSNEDDNRNTGLLEGILRGAKAIGDAIKGHNARSNGENIVRHISSGPAPSNEGECDYDCSGWPYQQCRVSKTFKYGGWKSATCISPYYSSSSYRMPSNYPECASVPSGCQRCDDVCTGRDNVAYYTETGPKY